ncbi:hypothetical protein M885DRAFT_553331 [Pelagophyceae sp. CCMP2097]|nr:hypothetical protein M885DRAFT_553331 [Pelagophyceae sp. CCMP2097]
MVSLLLCADFAIGLSLSRRTSPRSTIRMEDFGLLKQTQFSFIEEWSNQGRLRPELSETQLEKYLNKEGLRYRMDRTADEAKEGPRPIAEALGFLSTSNNAARLREKKAAIQKAKRWQDESDAWFYTDQLSTDDAELKQTFHSRHPMSAAFPGGDDESENNVVSKKKVKQ